MNLGKNLKEYRIKCGYTQNEVAEKLNVTPQAVSRWELDAVEPNIDTIKDLAALYKVSVDDLLELKEKEEPKKDEENVKQSNNEVNKSLPVIGECKICHKYIHPGEGVQRSIAKSRGGRELYYVCNECLRKEKIRQQQVRSDKNNSFRLRGYVFGGILSAVIGIIFILLATIGDQSNALIYYSFLAPAMILTFTFVFCVFMRNNFIGDMRLTVASWGAIKFPGIIFSFTFDGIKSLILIKIVFAIIGFVLMLGAIILATGICAVMSFFVFPFSIYWSYTNDAKTEI